uniref:SAC domain-containing protein n=1 Tax=Soboliphyme baturini TaxID=241478 RepID=A0A183IJL6_9BILA
LPIVHTCQIDHSQFDTCPEHATKVFKFCSESFNKAAFIKKVADKTGNFQFGASKGIRDRLLDEILQLFNEYGSDNGYRFFWNRHLIDGLLALSQWVTPIIHGYVFFRHCKSPDIQLLLISRRSVHRAGTRYIKRGIDNQGHCANYVESEQIVVAFKHFSSFVLVRASVPAFWSQPGYKYRPPPVITMPRPDNVSAFKKHLEHELNVYRHLVIVDLVEQSGKEKVLSDIYLDLVLEADRPDVTYVAFDFNAYCRGLRFDNVRILTSFLRDVLDNMKFCWVDKNHEVVCQQNSVARVNCVDCLDRTNLVQSAIARYVFEITLRKFGLIAPEEGLSSEVENVFRVMWANNGDYISRQYTGTVALKGDFTRTGERRIVGLMKDGYHSANRYYMCHMKDAKRQLAIDCLLAKEQIRLLVQDCEKLLVTDDEVIVGSWALIDVSNADQDLESEMDTVVVLTRSSYYICEYDEDADKFINFQPVCIRITYRSESNRVLHHTWKAASTRLFNNIAIQIKNVDEAEEYICAIGEQFIVALSLAGNDVQLEYCAKLPSRSAFTQYFYRLLSSISKRLNSVLTIENRNIS